MKNYIPKTENLQSFLNHCTLIESKNSREIRFIYKSEPKQHTCPHCNAKTSKVHDYRMQKIQDLDIHLKKAIIELKKRRYVCKECGKKFYETYDFLPRYARRTSRVVAAILEELKTKQSFTDVARKFNTTTTTILRLFNMINYGKPKLPKVLGIDEFKGNANGEKYQCILTDIANGDILDILPSRKKTDLIDYFKTYSRKERAKVEVFVMDMWQGYANIKWLFPNAKIVVDKFHYVRQVYWALDNVRKKIQKRFPKEKRLHFKNSKKILFKEYSKLKEENQCVLRQMLDQNAELYDAWQLKEWFALIMQMENKDEAKKELHYWVLSAEDSGIKEFEACVKAFRNWFNGITNCYEYKYSNGFTEGCNNFIKVLKRVSFGIKNFKRLRNKILHTHKAQKKLKQKIAI